MNLEIIKELSEEQKQCETSRFLQFKSEINEPNEQYQFLIEEDQDQDLFQDQIKETQYEPNIQKIKASFVVTGLGGFYTDEAIGFDNKKNEQPRTSKRLTLFSRVTWILGSKDIPEVDLNESSEQLFTNISKCAAWCILLYATCNNAMIPAWIMTIPLDRYLRISWRFLIQTIFLIPLIMFEYRNGNEKVKQAYQLNFIFKWENMRKLYNASFSPSVQSAIFLYGFEYTNVASVFILGSQTNLWLSILRKKQKNHFIEKYGQFIGIMGFGFICLHGFLLESNIIPENSITYINNFIYTRIPWLRVTVGNILPFVSSILLAELSKYNIEVRQVFPPFLSNFFIAIFVSFNVCMVAYFFDGTSFDLHSKYGLWGLWTNGKLIEFLYTSTVIIIGIFACSIITSKLFEPVVLASMNLFEPFLTSVFLKFTKVQNYPDLLVYIGYCCLQFGQFIIIVGQYHLKKIQELHIQSSNKQCEIIRKSQ